MHTENREHISFKFLPTLLSAARQGLGNSRQSLDRSFCNLAIFGLLMATPNAAFGDSNLVNIESLAKSHGLSVVDLSLAAGNTGNPKVSVNADKMRIPASVSKIPTALAALHFFPPGTTFKTQIRSFSRATTSTLKGDLCLVGGGDPGFVSETMWVLVNNFVRTGLNKIEGNLLVDDSLFDDQRFDESRESVRVSRAYDAPIGALSFNWNSVNVYFRPSKASGGLAEVILDPQNNFTILQGQVKTVPGKSSDVQVSRQAEGKTDRISVQGKLGFDQTEIVKFVSVSRPDLWTGENLRQFLKQRNIQITGEVKKGDCLKANEVLAEVASKTTDQIVADMNKFSNNFVAEMLAKHLGTLVQKPGSVANGMKKISEYMLELGVTDAEMNLTNPSGFNRENKMSAKALLKVLIAAQNLPEFYPELLVSLPTAGVDGTLKSRMKDVSRRVRAKTGLLNGVATLAGYYSADAKEYVPFVFLYNGSKDLSMVRKFYDALLEKLIEGK